MTIRPGEAWGTVGPRPDGLAVLRDDAALGEWLAARDLRPGSATAHVVGVERGDLARTVGGSSGGGEARRYPMDALRVHVRTADGETDTTVAAAHVAVRRRWWRGALWLIGNAEYVRGHDVFPRGHPNDGIAELLEVDAAMPPRARHEARRRARLGTHLPHPQLHLRRGRELRIEPGRALGVWVDGRRWRRATEVTVEVIADAYTLVV